MSTVQEYIINSQGTSGKEFPASSFSLTTSQGEIPLYPTPISLLRQGSKSYSQEINAQTIRELISSSAERGSAYPIWLVFNDEALAAIGRDITLPNGVDVPFLPFFSISGIPTSINERQSAHPSLTFDLGDRGYFQVAISTKESKEEVYEVSLANHTQADYDTNDYIRSLYPKGYSPFNITLQNYYNSQATLYTPDSQGKYHSSPLTTASLITTEGTPVLVGKDPWRDYAFCDLTQYEAGPYSWPIARYSQEGQVMVDAIFAS